MSENAIEIGDFWITKKNPIECEVIAIRHGNKVPIITSYSAEDDCTDSCTQHEFLRDYEFLRKADNTDMINEPPHYKDASGVECIEVTKQGRKDDSAKRRYSLLPKGAVNSVVDVLEAGAIKYSVDNWQQVPNARTRYYDAAMRHIDAWFNGDLKDAETGLPHLAHAICCLMFLMWFDSEASDD